MERQTPPISIAVVPFLMFCIIGMVIAVMIGLGVNPDDKTDIWFFAAGGIFVGAMVSFWPERGMVFRLLRAFIPERFSVLESAVGFSPDEDNDEDDEPSAILLEDKLRGITWRLSRLDTPLHYWTELAKEFVKSDYAYNQNIYESIFGREQEIGRTKYRLFSAQFEAAEIVKKSGSGYKFTDWGKEKMEQLAKGDWRILSDIPEDAVAI